MKKFIEKGNQFVEVYFNILIVFTVFYAMFKYVTYFISMI